MPKRGQESTNVGIKINLVDQYVMLNTPWGRVDSDQIEIRMSEQRNGIKAIRFFMYHIQKTISGKNLVA